eukprot:466962-Amphidinium_carterae.1
MRNTFCRLCKRSKKYLELSKNPAQLPKCERWQNANVWGHFARTSWTSGFRGGGWGCKLLKCRSWVELRRLGCIENVVLFQTSRGELSASAQNPTQ